jgi:ubiquinone/menaquinone biosynthesis C-methylase UbiE
MATPLRDDVSAMANVDIHAKWMATYRSAEAQDFYEMAFDDIVRRLGARTNDEILDAGCGTCAKSVLLAARGLRVVGADFSEKALELAERTVAQHGFTDRIRLQREDLTRLSFADGRFRHVLCWGVLMHVPELGQALAELSRVLTPGGRLVVSVANMHSLQAYAIRSLRRVLGRGRGRIVRTPSGLESYESTASGNLLTRENDMRWFIAEAARHGLRLESRRAGQLTELYALTPSRTARRAIHTVNRVWFRSVGLAGPAFGNLVFFEKR